MGSSNCMSQALPGITGAEIPELLGIILGLLEIVWRRRFCDSAVLMTCDPYVIGHVFEGYNPPDISGQKVWPAIALARRLLSVAEDFGISVSVEEVSPRDNPAPHSARRQIEYRRARGWLPGEDRWFYDAAFKSVFLCVSRNCSYPTLDLPPFHFSKGVLRACNDFFLELD